MAFEKMTADEIYDKFMCISPNWGSIIVGYEKIGARTIKMFSTLPFPLYFMWYDDTNWTFGTKLYRKRPEKLEKKIKALTDELKALEPQTKVAEKNARELSNITSEFTKYSGDFFKIY